MMKIGTKLALGMGIPLALCVVVGLVSYTQNRVVSKKIEEITKLKEPINSAVYGLENNLVETGFSVVGYISTGDRKLLETFQSNQLDFGKIQEKYFEVATAERENELGIKLNQGYTRFRAIAENEINLQEQQSKKMEVLLKDLDAIDALLTKKIRPSVKAGGPVAQQRLRAALEMEVNVNAIMKGLGTLLLTGQPKFESRVYDAEGAFKGSFQAYQNFLISSEEKEWARELRHLSDESFQLARLVIDIEKQKMEQLTEFIGLSRELRTILSDRIQIRTEYNLKEAKQDVLVAGRRADVTILLMLGFGLTFGIIAGVVTTRHITGPLHQLGNVMNAIAQGDTARRVELTSTDELRSLGQSFNLMTGKLVKANEELSVSEDRFRLLMDGVKDYAIFMLDPEGHVASWNAGAERIKGYTASEVIGRHCSLFYSPAAVAGGRVEAELNKAAETGRMENEGWQVRKDGSQFWANVVITALRNGDGVLQGFSRVTRDVTERRQMEEVLRESELRFRTIFEDAPIGIALSDSDGKFLQTNPAMQQMLGFSGEETGGKAFADAVHEENRRSVQECFTEMMEGTRGGYHMEIRYDRRDGRTGWSNLNVSRVTGDGEQPSYAIVMMEDITLRRATEQQMKMLAQTITSMNESVVITDLHNTILSVNPAFLKTYGYKDHEVLGRNVEILRPGTMLPGAVAAAIAAGEWTGELVNVRKNGEEFPILLSTSVVRDDLGKAIALVGIARDFTEQKRLQEKLNDAERRRSADLRRFAVSVQRAQEDERGRISRELHDDLCQRLSGMKFRVEVLEDETRLLSQKVYRQLRDFRQELDKTISEVRRVSSNLRPSVLDDFGLVVALKLLCKDFEKFHGLRTISHLGNGSPVRADANIEIALYRIAQEALSNIAKHATASKVALHLVHQDSSIQLIVEDNGKGFNQDDVSRAKTSGGGLGLISMRERAELLGGNLDVATAAGKGTTISVTIPLGEQVPHEENQDTHS